jgi:hypothetical protein
MKRLFNALMFGVSVFTIGVYTCETLNDISVPLHKWLITSAFGLMWLNWTVKKDT